MKIENKLALLFFRIHIKYKCNVTNTNFLYINIKERENKSIKMQTKHRVFQHLEFQKRMKHIFIAVNLFAFLISFLVFMPLAQAFKNLSYKCPLYSVVSVSSQSNKQQQQQQQQNQPHINASASFTLTSLKDFYIDSNQIKWNVSSNNSCEICIISGILCVFYTVITLCFSILFNVKHKMDKQILPVLFVLSLIQCMIMFSSAYILSNGFSEFCQLNLSRFKCYDLQRIKWTLAYDNGSLVDSLIVSMTAVWCLVLLMMANSVVLLVRIRYFLKIKKNHFRQSKEIRLITRYAQISRTRRKNIHLNETKL